MKNALCAIDLGSWSTKVCLHDGKAFHVVTNQANFRETPTLVGYTEKERIMGQQAFSKLVSNAKNTVRAPHRLIGLGKTPHLVEEQLKYSPTKYELNESVSFFMKGYHNQVYELQAEQLCIAFFGKIKKIVQNFGFEITSTFLVVGAYLNNYERIVLQKCSEAAEFPHVKLVEDWQALCWEYAYTRIKQIRTYTDPKIVIFVDIGYSKSSIYACQVGPDMGRIIDYQHLKYTGSKNMDQKLLQFYKNCFSKQVNEESLNSPKATISLLKAIQKHRKILSANNEHNLFFQFTDSSKQLHELSHTINRSQFQDIIMPVFSQLATALDSIKVRVQTIAKIDSIQLAGGASRTPFIQNIINEIFGIEPSRTLNLNEAICHGCAIIGGLFTGAISNNTYQVESSNLEGIMGAWNLPEVSKQYFGENYKLYPAEQCKIIFPTGCRYPASNSLEFKVSKEIQLHLFYEHELFGKSISYLRLRGPNKVIFQLDYSRVLRARLQEGEFLTNKMQERGAKWGEMAATQKKMAQQDQKILDSYDLKNSVESRLYKAKEKLNELTHYRSEAEHQQVKQALSLSEQWIESGHSLQEIENQLQLAEDLIQEFIRRKEYHQGINSLLEVFIGLQQKISPENPGHHESKQTYAALEEVYQQMERENWREQKLPNKNIEDAICKLRAMLP